MFLTKKASVIKHHEGLIPISKLKRNNRTDIVIITLTINVVTRTLTVDIVTIMNHGQPPRIMTIVLVRQPI